MKKHEIFFLVLFATSLLFPHESSAQVTGRVTKDNKQPLPHVNIIVKETEQGTQTDIRGRYAIIANPGDTLLFTYLGMLPVEACVKRKSSKINVKMHAISIELEEVQIKARRKIKRKTQKELLADYRENKNLIKNSWGIFDKDFSSTSMQIIDGEDLIPVGPDFLTSLQSHVPQMRVIRDDLDNPEVQVLLRSLSFTENNTVLFDVDGFIQFSPPTYLSANDIDRIAVLERNAAISRYGPQGAGGVIIVNTKAQTWMGDQGVNRRYDNRTLADSLLKEVTYLEPYSSFESSYIKELKEAKTERQILSIYEDQKERYLNNPYYFLEVYEFFLSNWGINEKSKELFQHLTSNFSNHIPALKALAYIQQQYGYYESALSIYLEILKLQFGKAQSHRNVANAYAEIGDFKKALIFYTQYINVTGQLTNTSFDAYGDDQLITTEMMNILERNKEVFLDSYDIDSAMHKDNTQTRLVFCWNNQDAEFELQFVTPDGYYDIWDNKPGKDVSQDLEAAKKYSSKQFFIDDENKGLWQVNINYKGNRSEMPTYLMVSVYHDYGSINQYVDIKVYRLYENHEKVQLLMLQQN